jgi:Na+-driven multidrug efflux pump
MSVLFGIIGALIGIFLTRPALVAMGYTGNLLELAVRYSYIYLACMPFLSLTNFLAAILQARGDTKTTLYSLTATGVLNIILNLFFVKIVGLSVEGVAIATAVANLVSSIVLWIYISKKGGDCKLYFSKLRMHREQFAEVLRVGLPAGVQSALFSLSNIIIQSSIIQVNNAVTPVGSAYAPVIKGSSAAQDIETFIFQALAATTVCGSAFTAQNVGANNCRRVRKIFGALVLISAGIALVMSVGAMLLRDPLLVLYGVKNTQDPLAQIAYNAAMTRIWWKWPAFFIYAMMNACAGMIRGLGKSSLSAIISIFTTCVFRVVWIYTAFRYFENLESIFISYPISWLLSVLVFLPLLFVLIKKNIEKDDLVKLSSSEL